MATAQSGRLESRVNSMPQFTAKLTQERETTYSTIRLAKTANWHDLGWTESLWRENWTSLRARLLSGSWLLRQVKDACFIGAARRQREFVRSLGSIRGLTSNLSPR